MPLFSGSFLLPSDSVLYPLVFVVNVLVNLHEWMGQCKQKELAVDLVLLCRGEKDFFGMFIYLF